MNDIEGNNKHYWEISQREAKDIIIGKLTSLASAEIDPKNPDAHKSFIEKADSLINLAETFGAEIPDDLKSKLSQAKLDEQLTKEEEERKKNEISINNYNTSIKSEEQLTKGVEERRKNEMALNNNSNSVREDQDLDQKINATTRDAGSNAYASNVIATFDDNKAQYYQNIADTGFNKAESLKGLKKKGPKEKLKLQNQTKDIKKIDKASKSEMRAHLVRYVLAEKGEDPQKYDPRAIFINNAPHKKQEKAPSIALS